MKITEGLIKPDLVFYLRPESVSEMAGRSDYGQERYENVQVQQKVIEKFDEIFRKELAGKIVTINSSRKIHEIANEIAAIVSDFMIQRC